jgi:hypothetical protein
MMSEPIPKSLEVQLSSMIALAVEHWRLSRWLSAQKSQDSAATARHAVARLGDFLSKCEVEARSLDGLSADAGLAARVVDVVEDPSMPAGQMVIEETLSPLVLWRGRVVKEADVVSRRGTGAASAAAKGGGG